MLFPIVWSVVRALEGFGFKVICLTCDGASANRSFFNMHTMVENVQHGVIYRAKNTIHKMEGIYTSCQMFPTSLRLSETVGWVQEQVDPDICKETASIFYGHICTGHTRLAGVQQGYIQQSSKQTIYKVDILL